MIGLASNITVGDLDVVLTGTVVCYADQHPTIDIGANGQIIVEFRFVVTGAEPTPENTGTIELSAETNSKLVITLKDWTNPLGAGLTAPVEIGNINGRRLYIGFVHQAVGSKKLINLLHYSFYTGGVFEQHPTP